MKVLLFIHSLRGGGAERVVVALANRWSAQGIDCCVLTLLPPDDDHYRPAPAVRRRFLDLAGSSSGRLAAATANVRRIAALRRVLREERPDVALAMITTCNVQLAIAARGMRDMVRVGSERVYPPAVRIPAAWHALRRRTYGWLDGVVCQTRDATRWVERHTRARAVRTIPNPAVWPLPTGEPRRAPRSVGQPGRKRMLAAGRLDPQKGFDLLIDAFARVGARARGWELVILGEGAERAALEARVRAHGVGDAIWLPGVAGNMADWYADADLFVLSSRFEGFPNVLVEAMAHGLPAVAVDCPTGPADIVRDGVDGLLVPMGDDARLDAALERVMSDDGLRAGMAAQASDVRARFALERVSADWLDFFRELRG